MGRVRGGCTGLPSWLQGAVNALVAAGGGVQPEDGATAEDLVSTRQSGDTGEVSLSCGRQERPGCPKGPGGGASSGGNREASVSGSAQLAGAHNPLGARLAQEKGAPGLRRGSCEERAGQLEAEGGSLEGCSPAYPGRPPGDRLPPAPGPALRKVGWAAKASEVGTAEGAAGAVGWGQGSLRGCSGIPPPPASSGGRRTWGTPPPAAGRLCAPPAPVGTAGAREPPAPPPENQTGAAGPSANQRGEELASANGRREC